MPAVSTAAGTKGIPSTILSAPGTPPIAVNVGAPEQPPIAVNVGAPEQPPIAVNVNAPEPPAFGLEPIVPMDQMEKFIGDGARAQMLAVDVAVSGTLEGEGTKLRALIKKLDRMERRYSGGG
jgi:hypothetical protein